MRRHDRRGGRRLLLVALGVGAAFLAAAPSGGQTRDLGDLVVPSPLVWVAVEQAPWLLVVREPATPPRGSTVVHRETPRINHCPSGRCDVPNITGATNFDVVVGAAGNGTVLEGYLFHRRGARMVIEKNVWYRNNLGDRTWHAAEHVRIEGGIVPAYFHHMAAPPEVALLGAHRVSVMRAAPANGQHQEAFRVDGASDLLRVRWDNTNSLLRFVTRGDPAVPIDGRGGIWVEVAHDLRVVPLTLCVDGSAYAMERLIAAPPGSDFVLLRFATCSVPSESTAPQGTDRRDRVTRPRPRP